MAAILVVENDLQLARTLHSALTADHYQVQLARTLAQAKAILQHRHFDVALIDLLLDDGSGLELVEYLHSCSFPTRTMIVSQLAQPEQRVTGLASGADDYLPKPISLAECLLRVRRLVSVHKLAEQAVLRSTGLTLYPETGQVKTGDQNAKHLRRRESQILGCLLKHKNRVVTREMLIDQIWLGESQPPTYSTIDVYLRRLRIALGDHGQLIETVRGFGYLLRDQASESASYSGS